MSCVYFLSPESYDNYPDTGGMRSWVERIIASVHESRTLAGLRGALLSKFISGKLRVKDAERFLEEWGL